MVSVTLSTSALAFLVSAASEVFGLGSTTVTMLLIAGAAVAALALGRTPPETS
jgi:hypothetical protein